MVTRKLFGKFRESLSKRLESLEGPPTDRIQINSQVDALARRIEDACRTSFPVSRRDLWPKPWWTDSLNEKKRNCYRARKAYQKAKSRTTKAEQREKYRKARSTYTQAVIQAKRVSWAQFVKEEGARDVWKVVRSIRRFDELPQPIATTTIQMADQTWEEVADKWLDHFIMKDDIENDTE